MTRNIRGQHNNVHRLWYCTWKQLKMTVSPSHIYKLIDVHQCHSLRTPSGKSVVDVWTPWGSSCGNAPYTVKHIRLSISRIGLFFGTWGRASLLRQFTDASVGLYGKIGTKCPWIWWRIFLQGRYDVPSLKASPLLHSCVIILDEEMLDVRGCWSATFVVCTAVGPLTVERRTE